MRSVSRSRAAIKPSVTNNGPYCDRAPEQPGRSAVYEMTRDRDRRERHSTSHRASVPHNDPAANDRSNDRYHRDADASNLWPGTVGAAGWSLGWLRGGLILATCVAYLPSFGGQYYLDDESAIISNPFVLGTEPWSNIWNLRRPVAELSLRLNVALSGLSLPGLHLTNLAIHVVAGLLLFEIARKLLAENWGGLSSPQFISETSPVSQQWHMDTRAALLAGCWLLHPLQVQSVTYIVQRMESLMGMFLLLSIDAFLRATRCQDVGRRIAQRGWLFVAALASWLAVGSKEVAITWPAVLLLVEWGRSRTDRHLETATRNSSAAAPENDPAKPPAPAAMAPLRTSTSRWSSVAVLLLAFCPAAVWCLSNAMPRTPNATPATPPRGGSPAAEVPDRPSTEPPAPVANRQPDPAETADWRTASTAGFDLPQLTPGAYLRTQPAVIAHYLWLTLWPAALAIDHDWSVLPSLTAGDPEIVVDSGHAWWALVAQVVVSGVFIAAVIGSWRQSAGGLLLLLTFCVLAPTSSILPIRDLMFEHRMYLPLVPLLAWLLLRGGWLLRQAEQLLHRRSTLRGSVPDSVSSTRVASQIRLALAVALLVGLGGRTFVRNLDYLDPVQFWTSNTRVVPDCARAWHNLAQTLLLRGDFAAAERAFRRAIELQEQQSLRRPPHEPQTRAAAWNGLGSARMGQSDFTAAAAAFQQAISLEPAMSASWENLGKAQALQGQMDLAAKSFARGALRPDAAASLFLAWGELALKQDQPDEAEDLFQQAITRDPARWAAYRGRAIARASQGDLRGARSDIVRARASSDIDTAAQAELHRLEQLLDAAEEAP